VSEPRVYHFALFRDGEEKPRERIATMSLGPDDLARVVMGGVNLEAAIEQQRRVYASQVRAAGYADGWTVRVIREQGYHRSIFPGVGPVGEGVNRGLSA
jgi:hypothetical protein